MAHDDHYTAGLELYRKGRYAQALRKLRHAAGADGVARRLSRFYEAMSHRGLGIEALRQGHFEQAEIHLRHAARTIGRSGDLGKYLAALYAKTGRYGRCAVELEKAVEQDPSSPSAWRRLAQAQWRSGRRTQAYMTLSTALRRLGGVGQLHYQMGLFLAAEEKFDQARASLARAVEADVSDAEAHYHLALVAAAAGDMPAAARSFQRAYELRPDDILTAYQLAIAARGSESAGCRVVIRLPETTGRTEGSEIRQLAAYVTREPEFIDAFLALPPSAADEELFSLLDSVLRLALDEHPAYADLHHRASRVKFRLDRHEAAMHHAAMALEINPSYVAALKHMGELCAQGGRSTEAIEYFERAIACGGDWADLHTTLAGLLRDADRCDVAAEHLRRALTINANYKPAAEALASLAA